MLHPGESIVLYFPDIDTDWAVLDFKARIGFQFVTLFPETILSCDEALLCREKQST